MHHSIPINRNKTYSITFLTNSFFFLYFSEIFLLNKMAARYPEALELADPIVGQINQFFDRVVACVDHRRRTLIAEVVDKRLEMGARVTHRAQKEAELMTVKGEVERKIKNNELRDLQERMLADIEEKLAEVRLPHPETHLVFQGECEQLEQLILNVGDVLEEEVAVIPRYQEMRKVVEVGKYGKNPGQLSSPRCVAIDENTNHIYVTECPARVSVFSESGEFLNTFTHEHMKHPRGIAIHLNNVYITDYGVHRVFQFKIESDMRLVARLGGEGSEDGKFNYPQQLTVSANGDVFVADYLNHRIQILDENLYHQRSIKHDSMKFPRDVKLTNNQMFVLTNRSSPCVHEFSIAGEKIRSFITRGQGMQVTDPCFFCLDALKNLIISDGRDRSVKIFSPDGTLLHSIGGFQDGGYYSPFGIALTKQLKIVVIALHDTFMLQIFSA